MHGLFLRRSQDRDDMRVLYRCFIRYGSISVTNRPSSTPASRAPRHRAALLAVHLRSRPTTHIRLEFLLPDMGLLSEFDDRQTQIESEAETYHPYEYQTENNSSWAGALPVKQYVS